MSPKASFDPVDLEKGVIGPMKEEEEELPAVNPHKSMRIKLLVMDSVALFYVLLFVGFTAWAIMVSNTWRESLPTILMMFLMMVFNLCLVAKMKECIQGHATEEKATLANDADSDLSTKLLVASSSNKN